MSLSEQVLSGGIKNVQAFDVHDISCCAGIFFFSLCFCCDWVWMVCWLCEENNDLKRCRRWFVWSGDCSSHVCSVSVSLCLQRPCEEDRQGGDGGSLPLHRGVHAPRGGAVPASGPTCARGQETSLPGNRWPVPAAGSQNQVSGIRTK